MEKDRYGQEYRLVEDDAPDVGEVHRSKNVYISLLSIPYDRTFNIMIYFVSNDQGDEFGQFATLSNAMLRADNISRYPVESQRQFDE